MNNNIIKDLVQKHPPELSDPFAKIIELIGIDNVLKLATEFGGSAVYFPKARTIFKESIDKQIYNEFNGGNYFDLAVKYGVCEKTIRNITNKMRKAKKNKL